MLKFLICSSLLAIVSKYLDFWGILALYWLYYALFELKLVQLIIIKLKDGYRLFKSLKDGTYFKRMYGVYGIVGEYGQGKTIEMSREYLHLQHKTAFHNPDDYIFISNFELADTEHFNDLNDVMSYYRIAQIQGKGLIVFWDEIQNEYPENDRAFPQAFRTLLTQNRKGKGVRLIWSTQDYTRVNKNIRLMTTGISHMRCFFGRYMIRRYYNRAVYEDYYACTDMMQKAKRKPLRTEIYIQTDKMRSVFDSFKMLDVAKERLGLQQQ